MPVTIVVYMHSKEAGNHTGSLHPVNMGLMRCLQAQGHVVVGMKPVASGCSVTSAGLLVNEDARRLQACASFNVPYRHVNPYAFEPPIAPHLAAQSEGTNIEVPVIEMACRDLTAASSATRHFTASFPQSEEISRAAIGP